MTRKVFKIVPFILLLVACEEKNPNLTKSGEDELKNLEVKQTINKDDIEYNKTFYVPVYSDIYVDAQNPKKLLSATLSIRNTSAQDSLFISKIDYFNTQGDLVRNYLEGPISLPPMATVNYVIEKEDDLGGSGANFIVSVSSGNANVQPLLQAIMIGQFGNKSFAFLTDGYALNP